MMIVLHPATVKNIQYTLLTKINFIIFIAWASIHRLQYWIKVIVLLADNEAVIKIEMVGLLLNNKFGQR